MSIRPFRKFPTKHLPEPARSFVREGAKAINCDECMVALPLLAVMAGCIGSAVRLRVKSRWFVPAIIWTCVVAKSGTAKSPAQALVIDLLRDIESDTDRRIVTTNATIEAVASKLNDQPKGLIYSCDELAGWISSLTKYSNGSSVDEWLSIYSGKSFGHDRKVSRSVFVRFANVCVAGGIQPDRLFDVFRKEHEDSGLMARLCFAQPPNRKKLLTESDVSPELLANMENRLRALVELDVDATDTSWKPRYVGLSADAWNTYRQFHDPHQELVMDNDGAFNAALSKLAELPLRIALTFSVFRYPGSIEEVDSEAIGAGISLTQWFVHEAERLYLRYQQTDEERQLQKLLELVHANPGASCHDLKRRNSQFNKMPSEEVQMLLRQLSRANLICIETVHTGKRPKTAYFPIDEE